MPLGAGIVIGACIVAASAAMLPGLLPQSGDLVPFDAGYLEAAEFIDDSRQAVRQDAATESDQQAPPIFGMETEPFAGELAAKSPSKPISIVNNKWWRAAARKKHVPSSHKTCWISLLKAPDARVSPVSA